MKVKPMPDGTCLHIGRHFLELRGPKGRIALWHPRSPFEGKTLAASIEKFITKRVKAARGLAQ